MNYIAISLYRKLINHALNEGLNRGFLQSIPTPIGEISKLKAVPADHFFELHELLDEKLGSGFSVRVGQQMKLDDYGVLGLAWKTCSWVGEIFDRSERYFKLLSNMYVFKVEKRCHLFIGYMPNCVCKDVSYFYIEKWYFINQNCE